jgi:hypothetical protein
VMSAMLTRFHAAACVLCFHRGSHHRPESSRVSQFQRQPTNIFFGESRESVEERKMRRIDSRGTEIFIPSMID